MSFVSFQILSQLLLGFFCILFILLVPSKACHDIFEVNTLKGSCKNASGNRLSKRPHRKRLKILFSFFLSTFLLLGISIASVESFHPRRKSTSSIAAFIRLNVGNKMSILPSSLKKTEVKYQEINIGNTKRLFAKKKDANQNEKKIRNEIFSLWEEKQKMYEGLEEDTNNLCDHCDNRESCKSIIQELETNQMLNQLSKVTEKEQAKKTVKEEEFLRESHSGGDMNTKKTMESIWIPLLNISHLKAGDLIPIDLDLFDLGINLVDESNELKKKHLLLAVGDSINEEELSVIDNVSPLLMLPINIYDIANQYQSILSAEEKEKHNSKLKISCGMKEGKGSFQLRKKKDNKHFQKTMEEKKRNNRSLNYEKKGRRQLTSTDSQIKSIMYNGKEYFYYEDNDEFYNEDYESYLEDNDADNFHPTTKDSQRIRDEDTYINEAGTNSMLPFLPSNSLGPMVTRYTSLVDFNERISNSKKNSFLALVQMYKLRINDRNILEVCLGKGQYSSY